jgi:hypothetical protein
MDSTLLLVLSSMAIFFLLFMLLLLVKERVELQLTRDRILLKYPTRKKEIQLDSELKSWKIQKATYLRWGVVYSINMLFQSGKRAAVNSRISPENFEALYTYLESRYANRREADDISGTAN